MMEPNIYKSMAANPNSQSQMASASSSSVRVVPSRMGQATVAPPLPPRPSVQTRMPSQLPYQYTNYGRYPLGATYSPYNSYSGMSPLGYGSRFSYAQGYPPWGDGENAFIRMAEESSRPAFQSIESMVSAVGSISMMLESTYHAVYSSYRAVLGVVDHFSRLRNHLAHVFSTLALIRMLQWFVQRVLYFLHLRKTSPSAEVAWSAAKTTALKSEGLSFGDHGATSQWPIFMFLGLIVGAPWLIFRIFSKMASKRYLEEKLHGALASMQGSEDQIAIALYDCPASQPGDLSIRRGQRLHLAPKSQQPKSGSWVYAVAENQSSGLVPANYICLVRKKSSVPKSKDASNLVKSDEQSASSDPTNLGSLDGN